MLIATLQTKPSRFYQATRLQARAAWGRCRLEIAFGKRMVPNRQASDCLGATGLLKRAGA
jgi:hypothetical protein